MNITARYLAVEVLSTWQASGEPVDLLLEKQLSTRSLVDARDKNLLKAIVYGVLRRQSMLDWVIEQHATHPLRKMQARTLAALRVGLYQLLFMDRIPSSAAINETVEALKVSRQPRWLTGFVNGLLRTVSAKAAVVKNILETGEDLPAHIRLNHPRWLIDRWQKRYGQEKAEQLCLANNTFPPVVLQVNTRRIERRNFIDSLAEMDIAAEPSHLAPAAVILDGYQGAIPDLFGYNQGLFHVQDEAAQLATFLMGPFDAPAYYLDGCAGLGGKTMQLAQLTASGSLITAVEPTARRFALLQENLKRLGHEEQVTVVQGELRDMIGKPQRYDRILIDAPCSGLGVIRRHPDIRWNRKLEDLARYQDMQVQLLSVAATLLASGGVLVYAVCSMEPEENEAVVDLFLGQHSGFTLSNAANLLPDTAKNMVDSCGFLRTTPLNGLDGFFATRIEKN